MADAGDGAVDDAGSVDLRHEDSSMQTQTTLDPQRGASGMEVLVATDGSEASAIGVELVAALDWPAGTHLLVGEAVDVGPGLFGGPWPAIAAAEEATIEAELRTVARQTVAEAAGTLAGPGRRVETEILTGRPASAIVERARSMHADLIVLGSRGHGTIDGMLMGSVSAEVIDHARVPVLVARGRKIERIVLGWDGSAGAARAADLLCSWPIFARTSVRVVSVSDWMAPWWTGFPQPGSPELVAIYEDALRDSRERHDRLAAEMAATLRSRGIDAQPQRREGDAAAQLLAAATADRADLIVLGTHGRTGLSRLVLGSVARNVVWHAPCSVLVTREPAA